MRAAVAVFLTLAGAVVALAAAGVLSSAFQWGMPHDPIAVFGTFLMFAVICAFPLFPVGVIALWLVRVFKLPRPAIEMLVWGGAGALLMQFFWNPMIDAVADASPSTVNADILGLVSFSCALLGGVATFIERRLG